MWKEMVGSGRKGVWMSKIIPSIGVDGEWRGNVVHCI